MLMQQHNYVYTSIHMHSSCSSAVLLRWSI